MFYFICMFFRFKILLKNNICIVLINNCLVVLFNCFLMNYKRLFGDMFRCVGYKGFFDIVRVFCYIDYMCGL